MLACHSYEDYLTIICNIIYKAYYTLLLVIKNDSFVFLFFFAAPIANYVSILFTGGFIGW